MPALIAVRSPRGDAAELARRAARPVLRQPWERIELWVDAGKRTAVAFAGETGSLAIAAETGCVAALDGELFVGDTLVSGPRAAETLLSAYDRGEDVGEAEGSYSAVVWDPRRELLLAATDRYATRPLYLADRADVLILASELKSIPAALDAFRDLSVDAVAVLLAYEHLFPRQALLAGVEAVPAATTVTIDRGGRRQEHRRWRYELSMGRAGDEREWVEEFARLLDRAVRRRVSANSAVAISGGLDSRCVASSLARQGIDAPAVSWGAAGSEDLLLGGAVAGSLGLPHRSLELFPGYLGTWAPGASWLFEGRFRALSCHQLALRPLRDEGIRSLLIGFSGDDVMRSSSRSEATEANDRFVQRVHRLRSTCLDDAMLDEMLAPAFASTLRGRAKAALGSELLADTGRPGARVAQLMFRNTQSPTLFADLFPARDPFGDYELLDFARTIPRSLRRDGRLERLFLQRDPRLARLPTTHDRTAPSASTVGMAIARGRERIRRRLRASAVEAAGIGSYAADLRRSSRPLLEVLLEPRTLARAQLRESVARRLVGDTLAGRITDMRAIGVLLTLELFQRQFVDGEGRRSSDNRIRYQPGSVGRTR